MEKITMRDVFNVDVTVYEVVGVTFFGRKLYRAIDVRSRRDGDVYFVVIKTPYGERLIKDSMFAGARMQDRVDV